MCRALFGAAWLCHFHFHVAHRETRTMAPKAAQPQPSNPLQTLWKAYNERTPDRLKFIDSFLLFLMLSGIMQFAYCVFVTNFPFNAFLAG